MKTVLALEDNINEKQIKELGFVYDEDFNYYKKRIIESDCNLCIDMKNRIIFHENYTTADMNCNARELLVELFDLFTKGIVKKVEINDE